MMIMIRMQDQFSYDKFHPHPQRTYRITSEYVKKQGDHWNMASTPLPLKDVLEKNTDIAESIVNIYPALNGKAALAGKELYLNGAFTTPSFFKVFGFSLAAGNQETALQSPNSIIISKKTAENFFGNDTEKYRDALGKLVTMDNGTEYIVRGILNDVPGKSHINYDAYASSASIAQLEKNKILPGKSADWFGFNSGYTYALLKLNIPSTALEKQLSLIANDLNKNNSDGKSSFHLQRIDKITPGHDYLDNEIGKGTSWSKIYFEAGLSLLILLAACFNYTNLTIAKALTRAKEVGIRKIVGARRIQVFIQYVIESIIVTTMALAFAWLILSFVIRYAPFNDDYEFIPSSFRYNASLFGWSIAFAIFTGLLAGTAPAWILSAFAPLRALKNLSTAKMFGKISLQKAFIVFQYSLSLVIIIFLFAFYRQFAFMAAADPGFKKENVIILPLDGLNAEIAKQKIAATSGVQLVAAMSSDFGKRFDGMSTPAWLSNKGDAFNLNYYYADASFIPAMQIPFVAGRNFPVAASADDETFIVVNERLVNALGLKNAAAAVGQKL